MSTLNGVVTIQARDYQRLLERDLDLEYLENNGVDNWSGYGSGDRRDEQDDAIIRAKVEALVVAGVGELTPAERQMLVLSRVCRLMLEEECPDATLTGLSVVRLWDGWRLNINGIRPDGGNVRIVITPAVPADADYEGVVATLIHDWQPTQPG